MLNHNLKALSALELKQNEESKTYTYVDFWFQWGSAFRIRDCLWKISSSIDDKH